MRNNIHNKNDNKRKRDTIEKLYQNKINDLKQKSINSKKNGESYKKEYEQIKKHIKEMREVDFKKEIKNNSIIAIIAVSIVAIFLFISIGSIKYSMNNTKKETINKVVVSANNEIDSDKKEINDNFKNDNSNDKSLKQSNDKKEDEVQKSDFSDKVYKYLSKADNRQKMLKLSVTQNNNKNKGMNLIFLSNILNANGVKLSKNIINNVAFKKELEKNGFKSYTNPNQLQKGDIIFTIDGKDTPGVPSHVYIFMGGADSAKRVGYVVDGQVSIYRKTYHKRAITVQAPTTDKMQFFMRK